MRYIVLCSYLMVALESVAFVGCKPGNDRSDSDRNSQGEGQSTAPAQPDNEKLASQGSDRLLEMLKTRTGQVKYAAGRLHDVFLRDPDIADSNPLVVKLRREFSDAVSGCERILAELGGRKKDAALILPALESLDKEIPDADPVARPISEALQKAITRLSKQ